MITALIAAWRALPAYAYFSFGFLLYAPLVYLSQKLCARLATEKNQKIPLLADCLKTSQESSAQASLSNLTTNLADNSRP